MAWPVIKSRCNMRRTYVAAYAAFLKKSVAGATDAQSQPTTLAAATVADASAPASTTPTATSSSMDSPEIRNIEKQVSVEVALVWR